MNKRNSGIDLLKIISMFGVVVLHALTKGGVLDYSKTSLSTNSFYWIFECLFYCSVNCFGLASGYLSTSNELNISKIIKMWFQVVFYTLVVDLALLAFGLIENYTETDVIKDITPVISNLYWYFNAYIPLFFVKGYIKTGLDNLSVENNKVLFVLLVIIFCCVGLIYDPFGVGYGYTSLWIILLYIFGYLVKKLDIFGKVKSSKLVLIYILCTSFNWLLNILLTGVVINYNSPTVLLSAICLLVVFSRLNIKNDLVSKLSALTFGVYLFHANQNISKLLISDRLLPITNLNPVIVMLITLLFALLVFVIGMVIEFFRQNIYKLLKMDKLSSLIGKLIESIINKTKQLLFAENH